MEPNGFDAYKPWALASTFGVLSLQDDTTGANAMAIDVYQRLRGERGQDHRLRGDLRLQGGIFDGLSAEYQGGLSDASLAGYEGMLNGEAAGEGSRRWPRHSRSRLPPCLTPGRTGTPMPWRRSTAEAILNSDDELNSKLFTERDPGMIAAAAEYLETEGENTFFLAVGAGHNGGSGRHCVRPERAGLHRRAGTLNTRIRGAAARNGAAAEVTNKPLPPKASEGGYVKGTVRVPFHVDETTFEAPLELQKSPAPR